MPDEEQNEKNKKQKKSWETLVYELFECLFSQIMPGCVVVFLYVPQLSHEATKSPSFISAIEFLIPAWIAGISVNTLSYQILKKIHDKCGGNDIPNLNGIDLEDIRIRAT